jgi:hypothetical protein
VSELVVGEGPGWEERFRHRLSPPAAKIVWAAASPAMLVIQVSSESAARILAFDPRTGKLFWDADSSSAKGALVGKLLVTHQLAELEARDATTGAHVWSYSGSAEDLRMGGVYDFFQQGDWLIAATDSGLQVLDLEWGEASFNISSSFATLPVARITVAIEGDVLYVVDYPDLRSRAVNLRSGATLWTSALVTTETWVEGAAVGEKYLFACVGSAVLVGWDKRNGRQEFALGVPGCDDFELHPGKPEEISLGEERGGRRLRFRPVPRPDPHFVLEGVATDRDRRPLGHELVWAGLSKARTDRHGRYRIDPRVAGEVCIDAGDEDLRSGRICVLARPGKVRRLDLILDPHHPEGPVRKPLRLPD